MALAGSKFCRKAEESCLHIPRWHHHEPCLAKWLGKGGPAKAFQRLGGSLIHSDRLLLVRAEGDEGAGGRCERPPVPPAYHPEPHPQKTGGRVMFARLRRALAWLEDSVLGDAIGAACLFATLYVLLIIGGALQ